MPTCVEGHISTAADYCDVCGSAIAPAAAPAAAPTTACPACGASISGRFCESCGHDSALPSPGPASGSPSAATPQPVWTAVVAADREFYDRVLTRGGPDTVEFPRFFPERRIVVQNDTTLIGRGNASQGITPEIDLGLNPADRGVSSQHAVLRRRGDDLTVTDLGSTNGTSLNDSETLLAEGQETPLADGDRIHVGAWTSITVTRASP